MRQKRVLSCYGTVSRAMSTARKPVETGLRCKSTLAGKNPTYFDENGQPIFTEQQIQCIKDITSPMILDLNQSLTNIAQSGTKIERRLSALEGEFASIDKRLAVLETGFSYFQKEVDRRFEQVDKRFEQVDKRFEQVDKRFDLVDRRFEQLNSNLKWSVGILIAAMGLFSSWEGKDRIKEAILPSPKSPSAHQ